MKLGLIGAGNWGRNHLRTFALMPEISLTVCDTNEQSLAVAKREHPRISITQDVHTLISDTDAVVIASPANTHFAFAREALLARKPTFVEKPLALRPEHGEELVELAEAHGQVLMVGHLLLFHPAVQRLGALIGS